MMKPFDRGLGNLVAMNWVFAVLLGSFIYSYREYMEIKRKMSEVYKS